MTDNIADQEVPAGQQAFGAIAPGLAAFTDEVLFGNLWQRSELSTRERSLVTVTALVTAGNTEQLHFHLPLALKNGVTQEELIEIITHLAFYAGWPRAASAITVAKEIFAK